MEQDAVQPFGAAPFSCFRAMIRRSFAEEEENEQSHSKGQNHVKDRVGICMFQKAGFEESGKVTFESIETPHKDGQIHVKCM